MFRLHSISFARFKAAVSWLTLFMLVGFGLWVVSSSHANASAQSRRVVTDAVSGIALHGYDPVAYFTDKKALVGKHYYEHVWRGVSWTFVSEANLEVFKADPEVYAPQYGGHGALAMARGFVSGSNPTIWAIFDDRLYLFYSYTARVAWAQAVEAHINRADEQWLTLEGTLAR